MLLYPKLSSQMPPKFQKRVIIAEDAEMPFSTNIIMFTLTSGVFFIFDFAHMSEAIRITRNKHVRTAQPAAVATASSTHASSLIGELHTGVLEK